MVADFTLRWLGLLANLANLRSRMGPVARPEIVAQLDAVVAAIKAEFSDLQLAVVFGFSFDLDAADQRLRQLVGEFHEIARKLDLCPHCNGHAIGNDA